MLARSAMIVVFVPDEKINPGRRMLDGCIYAYGFAKVKDAVKVPQRRAPMET